MPRMSAYHALARRAIASRMVGVAVLYSVGRRAWRLVRFSSRRHLHTPPIRPHHELTVNLPPSLHPPPFVAAVASRGSGHSRGIPLISKIIIIYTREFCPPSSPLPRIILSLSPSTRHVPPPRPTARSPLFPSQPADTRISRFFSSFPFEFQFTVGTG